MKGMVAEKLLPYPCLMWEEGTGEERLFIYPCREQEEGTEEERLFIYPSREREEGTAEERLRLYPRRKREEGTEDESRLYTPTGGSWHIKCQKFPTCKSETSRIHALFDMEVPKIGNLIYCFSSIVCYNIDG